MKYFFAVASVLVGLALAVPCFAGHIQVKCEPGIQIFLNGELKGVSSSDVGGLILQNVPAGSHRLRAVKPGFAPRDETITISGNEVKVWNIEKFVPQVKISQEGEAVQGKIEQRVGTLVLQTLPVEVKIDIPSLGVSQNKNMETWKVEDMPVGEDDVRVSGMGKSLSYRVKIAANDTSRLFFNVISRKVEDQNAGQPSWGEMIRIPAGTFTMGDTHGDGDNDEKPTHSVAIAAFRLDKTEVSNAQFARFIQAGNTAQGNWQQYSGGREQHPVVGVTWHDAVAYCRWAGKRLPTEAEWEYAARGTDGRKYPWGTQWDPTRARHGGNRGTETTAPVGTYPSGASPFGVLDLAGNVWEWVSSLYRPYPYSAADGREDLNASGRRVDRGGSWDLDPRGLRSAFRGRLVPANRLNSLGFRCAQGVQ